VDHGHIGMENERFNSIPVAPLGIIALEGCTELAKQVNDYLCTWRANREGSEDELYTFPGYERNCFLLASERPRFGSGEGKAIIRESVRGYDLYIMVDVCSTTETFSLYGREVPLTADDHYQDLIRTISAVSGKAHRINVIMPYLYEGRQHRRSSRESLDCAIALQQLEHMGVDNILTFTAHDPRVQNAIPLMGFDNIIPYYQILKGLLSHVPDLVLDKDHLVIVSPDEGGVNNSIYFASVLSLPMYMFYKRRDYASVINGRNPIVAHEYLGDDITGKDVFIFDDMISSGDSLLDVVRELKRRGAGRIFMAVTYSYFTGGIGDFQKAYEEGVFNMLFSTNLSYRPKELLEAPWHATVDMSKYLAYLIASINYDHSISKFLNPMSRIQNLLRRHNENLKKIQENKG